jgi:hypothetical protein
MMGRIINVQTVSKFLSLASQINAHERKTFLMHVSKN